MSLRTSLRDFPMPILLCSVALASIAAGEDIPVSKAPPPVQHLFPECATRAINVPQPPRFWDVQCNGDLDKRIEKSWQRLHRAPYDTVLLDFRKDPYPGYETPGRAQFALSLLGQYRHEVSSLLERSFAQRPRALTRMASLPRSSTTHRRTSQSMRFGARVGTYAQASLMRS